MSTRSPTRPCARHLKKNARHPRRRKMRCIPDKPSAEFVYHMEDVLEVYHRRYDPTRPGVGGEGARRPSTVGGRGVEGCGAVAAAARGAGGPLPMRPGLVECYDYGC